MTRYSSNDTPAARVLKLCGADIELGNFVLGLDRAGGTCYEASRALLREIDGQPKPKASGYAWASGAWQSSVYGCRRAEKERDDGRGSLQDWGRKFLPVNGGCVYIDLDHLELCIPEVTSAWDHVAAWHAMLRIARQALDAANREQPQGRKIQVLVNNSDGQGNSYGSHLNFLVSRHLWDSLFLRRFHLLLSLASFQVSSIVFTGQGKVGAENETPDVPFQIAQRADFFETLLGQQTTYQRPIVNSRDEAHCGSWRTGRAAGQLARLHTIFFDNTLAHTSCLLKVGTMQIVLAMLEAGWCRPELILDDPVEAVVRTSHDPTLKTCVSLASGRRMTAVELQLLFLEQARQFAADDGFEGVVPRATEILDLWEDTLAKLQSGDFGALAPRLDWVMKLSILQRAMDSHPGLDWEATEIKLLDHLYSSLGDDGLYWAYENSGFAERVIASEQVQRFVENPPEDTRAWTRAMLLRKAEPGAVDSVDWDSVTIRSRGRGYWPVSQTVNLADPLGFTRTQMEPVFGQAATLEPVLQAIAGEAVETRPTGLEELARSDEIPRRLRAN